MTAKPTVRINTSMISDFITPVSNEENKNTYLKVNEDGKIVGQPLTTVASELLDNGIDAKIQLTVEEIQEVIDELQTNLEKEIAKKANTDDVNDELAKKVDAATYNVDKAVLEDSINTKANTNDVYTKNEIDSTVSGINGEVAKKANQTDVDTTVAGINEAIAKKADSETVNTELAKKANTNDVYTKVEIDSKVASVYKVKGSVDNYDSLPIANQIVGDVYNVLDSGSNYVWTDEGWDKLSETVDLTPYLTKEDAEKELAEKVNVSEYEADKATFAISADVSDSLELKADKAETYTKTEIDEIVNGVDANLELYLKANDASTTYATKNELPTKVSELENDSGYLTEHQDISGKADIDDVYTKTESDDKFALKSDITSESYTAGDGIIINDSVISVNKETVGVRAILRKWQG